MQYDPMTDFWKRFWPFVFQQTPVAVFAICVWWYQRGDFDRMEARHMQDRLSIRKECAEAIDELRGEFRDCQSRNDTLIQENIALNRRVAALEARLKL